MNYIQIGAVILAGIAVAIADALIKKTSTSANFLDAIKNPFMLLVVLLYLLQIFFFVYIFMNNWHLGIVGNLQMIFYSMSVVLMGLLFFGETITLVQSIGIVLALVGVFLINS